MNLLSENLKKIISVVKVANQIDGRTRFQKIIYVLKSKGVSFDEKYKYYYFGPFSGDLQLEIDELTDRGILNEYSSNPYKYSVNEEFKFEEEPEILLKKDLIKFLSKQDLQELELVSTILFLKNNGINNNKVISEKLRILKPHLSNKIESAYDLYNKVESNF